MNASQELFYTEPRTETLAEVRDAMNRCGDFEPAPGDYAQESSVFEVLAVLEALTIEDEVLA
jgi:hypothetical protein